MLESGNFKKNLHLSTNTSFTLFRYGVHSRCFIQSSIFFYDLKVNLSFMFSVADFIAKVAENIIGIYYRNHNSYAIHRECDRCDFRTCIHASHSYIHAYVHALHTHIHSCIFASFILVLFISFIICLI